MTDKPRIPPPMPLTPQQIEAGKRFVLKPEDINILKPPDNDSQSR